MDNGSFKKRINESDDYDQINSKTALEETPLSSVYAESDLEEDPLSSVYAAIPDDPYRPKPGIIPSTLIRRPPDQRCMTLPANRTMEYPPPLPKRGDSFTTLQRSLSERQGTSWPNTRARVDSGPHDFPRGSSHRIKTDLEKVDNDLYLQYIYTGQE